MLLSKTYTRIALIWLLGLATADRGWTQENGGEVESFNRSLGLEGMSTDLANVEHELAHNTPASPPESPKKGPAQKKAPAQPAASFSNLAFQANPGATNTVRALYVSRMNVAALVNARTTIP